MSIENALLMEVRQAVEVGINKKVKKDFPQHRLVVIVGKYGERGVRVSAIQWAGKRTVDLGSVVLSCVTKSVDKDLLNGLWGGLKPVIKSRLGQSVS